MPFFTAFWTTTIKNPVIAPFYSAPKKAFEKCTRMGQHKEVKKILESTESPKVALLAAKKGFEGAAFVIKKLAQSPKSQGDALKSALKNSEPPIMTSPEEA